MLERGAGGDDVVDHQHTGRPTERPIDAWPCPEAGTLQTLEATVPGLWARPVLAVQQPPTRHAEMPRHLASDEFGLIEPTRPPASSTGGCPRDHTYTHERPYPHSLHGQGGQLLGHPTTMPILQRVQHLAHHTRKREWGQHIRRQRHVQLGRRRGAHHREPTPWAHQRPGRPTPGAARTNRTERCVHADVLLKGCHRDSRG